MRTKPPLTGRKVRFEGKYRGLEGIVLEVTPDVHMLRVWLEVTSYGPHGMMPPERDGARPIVHVVVGVDTSNEDRMFVMPGPDGETIAVAARTFLEDLDAFRRSRWMPEPERHGLRQKLYQTRTALESLLGLPITYKEPEEPKP